MRHYMGFSVIYSHVSGFDAFFLVDLSGDIVFPAENRRNFGYFLKNIVSIKVFCNFITTVVEIVVLVCISIIFFQAGQKLKVVIDSMFDCDWVQPIILSCEPGPAFIIQQRLLFREVEEAHVNGPPWSDKIQQTQTHKDHITYKSQGSKI